MGETLEGERCREESSKRNKFRHQGGTAITGTPPAKEKVSTSPLGVIIRLHCGCGNSGTIIDATGTPFVHAGEIIHGRKAGAVN